MGLMGPRVRVLQVEGVREKLPSAMKDMNRLCRNQNGLATVGSPMDGLCYPSSPTPAQRKPFFEEGIFDHVDDQGVPGSKGAVEMEREKGNQARRTTLMHRALKSGSANRNGTDWLFGRRIAPRIVICRLLQMASIPAVPLTLRTFPSMV